VAREQGRARVPGRNTSSSTQPGGRPPSRHQCINDHDQRPSPGPSLTRSGDPCPGSAEDGGSAAERSRRRGPGFGSGLVPERALRPCTDTPATLPTPPAGQVPARMVWFNSYTPPQVDRGRLVNREHSYPFWPGEEAGAAASRGREGPAWGHTARHPRFTEGWSRARPSLGGAEGAAGGSRGAQALRDVISSDWKGGATRTSTGLTRPRTRCASPRSPPATASPPPGPLVWCPSYPPSVCSVTEGGGVM
jgi:hypothetical protein